MDIMHQINLHDTIVAVGRHDGFDIDPVQMLFEKEKKILHELSPRKKSEWLASRELLFRIAKLPERVECMYDDFGKPYLKGMNKHISVSHSGMWASAMVSDKTCGVDIQVYSHTVERIANKFLSTNEINQTERLKISWHHLHLLWGAKECMYKAYGRRKLEFKQHIFIKSIDVGQCTGIGEIRFEDIHLEYEIHFRILPEAAWVFCVEL
jgi:phosphopantetheinyl transferase (holo-ACP synthase)